MREQQFGQRQPDGQCNQQEHRKLAKEHEQQLQVGGSVHLVQFPLTATDLYLVEEEHQEVKEGTDDHQQGNPRKEPELLVAYGHFRVGVEGAQVGEGHQSAGELLGKRDVFSNMIFDAYLLQFLLQVRNVDPLFYPYVGETILIAPCILFDFFGLRHHDQIEGYIALHRFVGHDSQQMDLQRVDLCSTLLFL